MSRFVQYPLCPMATATIVQNTASPCQERCKTLIRLSYRHFLQNSSPLRCSFRRPLPRFILPFHLALQHGYEGLFHWKQLLHIVPHEIPIPVCRIAISTLIISDVSVQTHE